MWFGRVVLLLGWCQLWDGVLFFGSPLVVYILLALAQGFILITYIGAPPDSRELQATDPEI
jgi:hypothetical protein